MKVIRYICRVFVGLVFIFSGFVKGVDPLGTAYKIEDYFYAYQMEWALPAVLFLSIFLCAFEFVIGVLLLFNVRMKLASWLTLLMMSGFTILTLYDAIENPVPDCGCFGEFLILTNWQTFYKNIIIMIPVVVVIFGRKKFKCLLSMLGQNVVLLLSIILFVGFSYYNYQHLPMIDFRVWKVGNRMSPKNPLPKQYFIKYRDKQNHEEREYLSKDIPWQDSTWVANWEFIDTREVDPNVVKGHGLGIEDAEGNDVTENIIDNPDYQFIVIVYDLLETNIKSFKKLYSLYQKATKNGYSFVVITSSNPKESQKFIKENDIDYELYHTDDTALKTVIRSNPGLMLMKNSVVLAKWHYNDIPRYEYIDFDNLYSHYVK